MGACARRRHARFIGLATERSLPSRKRSNHRRRRSPSAFRRIPQSEGSGTRRKRRWNAAPGGGPRRSQYASRISLRVLRGVPAAARQRRGRRAIVGVGHAQQHVVVAPRRRRSRTSIRGASRGRRARCMRRGAEKRSVPSLSTCTRRSCRTVAVFALWRSCAGNPAPARLAYRSSSSMTRIPRQGRRSKDAAKVAVNSGRRIAVENRCSEFRDPQSSRWFDIEPARMIQERREFSRFGAGEQSSRTARNNRIRLRRVRAASCDGRGAVRGALPAADAASAGVG